MPTLQPYRAVNYDAGVEYYPAPGAILSAGYFHKDIRNPIYSASARAPTSRWRREYEAAR
jgi:outer membrane receptor protein involved in Fe transport